MSFFMTILSVEAQKVDYAQIVDGKFLNYGGAFPEDLLSSRTAVLVRSTQVSSLDKSRGPWKEISAISHRTFKDLGIDAMAYYNADDFFATGQTRYDFALQMVKRRVSNILIIDQQEAQGRKVYNMVITSFNGKRSLIDHGSEAWRLESGDLKEILKELEDQIVHSTLVRENNLVLDEPEYFEIESVIKKKAKRYKTFPSDLTVDKLAIPIYEDMEVPESFASNSFNQQLQKDVNAYNSEISRRNQLMKEYFASYPFQYEFLEYDRRKEDHLLNNGFNYVLLTMETSGESIKKSLEYDDENIKQEVYTSQRLLDFKKETYEDVENNPATGKVVKFYIKHLLTGNVYVCNPWEASSDWEKSIRTLMLNMSEAMSFDKRAK